MNRAFSLIELMVVIAIISLLSAVAVPAYQNYIIKSNLAKAYDTMQAIARIISSEYDRAGGTFPTSVAYADATWDLADGNDTQSLNIAGVPIVEMSITYTPDTANVSGVPYDLAFLQAVLDDSVGAASGRLLRSAVSVNKDTNVINYPCGIWTGAGNNPPQDLIPSSCDCTSMQSYQGSAPHAQCN